MSTPHPGGKPLNLLVLVTPSRKANPRRRISHLGEGIEIEVRPIALRDQIPQIVVDLDKDGLGKQDGMTSGQKIGADLTHLTRLGGGNKVSRLRHLNTMSMAKAVVGDIEIDHERGTVIPSVPLV